MKRLHVRVLWCCKVPVASLLETNKQTNNSLHQVWETWQTWSRPAWLVCFEKQHSLGAKALTPVTVSAEEDRNVYIF